MIMGMTVMTMVMFEKMLILLGHRFQLRSIINLTATAYSAHK
jgi:hypothetical protein